MKDTVSRSWFAVFPYPEQHGYTGTPEEIIEKLKNERKGKTPFEQKEINMKIAKYRTYYNECLDIANHLLARHKGVA